MDQQPSAKKEMQTVMGVLVAMQAVLLLYLGSSVWASLGMFVFSNLFGDGISVTDHMAWLWSFGIPSTALSLYVLVQFAHWLHRLKSTEAAPKPQSSLMLLLGPMVQALLLIGLYIFNRLQPRSFINELNDGAVLKAGLAVFILAIALSLFFRLEKTKSLSS